MKRLKLPGMLEMPDLYGQHIGDLRYMRGSIANREVDNNTSLNTIDTTLPDIPERPKLPEVKPNDYVRNKVEEDILNRQAREKKIMDKYSPDSNFLVKWVRDSAEKEYNRLEGEKANIDTKAKNPNVIQRYQAEYQAEKDFEKKQEEVQAQGGLMKGLGRAWYKASDSVMPGAVDKNSKLKAYENIDTGSKIGNLAADFVGNTIGLTVPTANSGVSEMNVADDVAEFGAKKLMPKAATKGQRIAQNTVRGAIDGAIGGTIDTAREYIQTGEFNPVENIGMGTVGGAALFGGSKALGEGMDHVKTLRDIKNITNTKDVTMPNRPPTAIYDTQVPGPKVETPKTEAPKEPVMEQPQNLGSKVNTKFGDGVLIGREGSKLKVAFEDGTTKTINKSKATITTEQVPIPEIKPIVKPEPVQEAIKPIEDIKQPEEIKSITEPIKAPKSNKTVLEKNVEDLDTELMLAKQMGYPKREIDNLTKDLELARAELNKYMPQLQAKQEVAPTKTLPEIKQPIKEAPKVQEMPKTETKQEPKSELDERIDTLKGYIEVNKRNLKLDYTDKQVINKKIKGYHMEISALERQKVQGDSLELIPGGLTPKELEAKKKKLASNYVGKKVNTPDGKAEIVGNSFGKVRAKLENGEVKSYTKDQVKEYTIPEKSNNNIDMQLFGAKTENGKPVSEFKTNTLKESEFLQNEKAQETIDDIAMTFDIKTNKATLQNAKEELDFDTQSTIDRISETGLEDAEDVVAAAIITNDLVVKNDYKSLKNWLKIVQPEITNIAQSLQAVSVWKKITPEGTLLKAQKIVDIVNKKLETENPIAFKEATTKIEELEKQIKDLQSKLDKKKATGTGEATGSKTKKTKSEKTPEELKIIELEKEIQKLINKNKMAQLTEADIKFITENMKKYNELPKDSIEQRETLAIVKKLMGEKIPPTFSDKLLAYQRINLLGNTKTMIRNVGGNVFMGGLENAKDGLFGIAIDKGISKLTESNLGKKLPSELRGQRTLMGLGLKEQGKGLVGGLKQVDSDYKKGIDTSRLQGQYEIPQSQAFRLKKGELKHIVNNTFSRAEKLVNYGLKLGDTPFVEAAYRGELYNQMKIKGTKEVTDEMIQKALDVAADRTFQNTTNLVNQMKRIQKALNLGKDFGLGNIVMPYVKTPANILDKAVDYSPIGGVKGVTNLIVGMKKGTLDQRKVVNQLSRGLTGSTLMYLGYKMAESGVLQGKGADDMEAAAVEKQSGKMPYSIKIGNTHFTIDWVQPFAIPLMIGADTYKGVKNEDGITKTIFNAIVSGGSTLFDQSLLTGVADLFKGYSTSGGENLMQGLGKTAANTVNQAVPFGSAMKQVAQLTDTKQRDTSGDNLYETTKNKIQSNIPILSKKLPQKVDTVGRDIEKFNGSKGIGYVLNTLVNPGQITKNNPSEAERLALDLYNKTDETRQMPRLADKEITYTDKDGNKAKYKLTAAEKNELQKVMGKTTEKYFAEYYSKNKGKKMQDPVQDLQTLLTKIEKAAKEDFLYKKGLID